MFGGVLTCFFLGWLMVVSGHNIGQRISKFFGFSSGNDDGDRNSDFTPGEDCDRYCSGSSKNCYFKFFVERYTAMGGACGNCSRGVLKDCYQPQCITTNGFNRPIMCINRQVPSPLIQICKGDRLIVDIVNQMPDEVVTIHWHGIKHKGSQYYDGVPFVTQCPILPRTTFRYNFVPDAAGTFFYHSHIGIQKFDGISGPLIVKEIERNEELYHYYDEDLTEHVVFIQDWTNLPGVNRLPGYTTKRIPQLPDTFLINGRGLYYDESSKIRLPIAEFVVKRGKRYRFRLIGGTCLLCAVSVTFTGHQLLAITADGGLTFTPLTVDTVILNSADRFDVVLEANRKQDTYLIYVQSVNSECGKGGIRQVAFLRYEGAEKRSLVQMPPPISYGNLGRMLNAVNSTCDGTKKNEICYSMLEGTSDANGHYKKLPYRQFNIILKLFTFQPEDLFRSGTYQHYEEAVPGRQVQTLINNISFTFPSATLISQYNDVPKKDFCEKWCYDPDIEKPCACTNIYNIPLGFVVDLILLDQGRGTFNHPFHLHGYNFYVLETGIFLSDPDEELEILKKRLREDKLHLLSRPLKDTITIPSDGYVVVRFFTDNPGYWLFHCHFSFHLEGGMGALFWIGDYSDLPPVPRNFPKCGNFII